MTDHEELGRVLAEVLARRGRLQTWQLVALLRVDGWEQVTLRQAQGALDEYQGSRFEQTSTVRRRYGKKRTQTKWRLTDHAALFDPDLRTGSEQVRDVPPPPFGLRPWQQEALDAWRAGDRRGVVEAVTGSGKTRVGVAAAFEELWDGGLVTVLTPRVVLVRQWAEALREALPGLDVAERHSGASGSADADVLVSTVQSAIRDEALLGRPGLLIADECHWYGAETFAKGLLERSSKRLGLTATYDRLDDGVESTLDPYFGGTCFSLTYQRAVPEGSVAPFTVGVVRVPLVGSERQEYDEAQQIASTTRNKLITDHDAPEKPFGAFLKVVSEWAQSPVIDSRTRTARRYLDAFAWIREVLAEAEGKYEALQELLPALRRADRTLIFTQRIEAAERVRDELDALGMSCATLHSDLSEGQRNTVFERFRKGHLKALVAVRVLDEGIDVPDADFAVVMAGTQVRRQMIQRMGRVLRLKPDGRVARFALLVADATTEDPLRGGHEGFFREITDVAVSVRSFSADQASQAAQFLSKFALPEAYVAALDVMPDMRDDELHVLAQLAGAELEDDRWYAVKRERFPTLVDSLVGVERIELGEHEQVRVPGDTLRDVARLGSMLLAGRQQSRGTGSVSAAAHG